MPQAEGDKPNWRKFKTYPIGYFHIDIAEVRTEQGKLCLFVGIDRTSKFAFVELHEKATRRIAETSCAALARGQNVRYMYNVHYMEAGVRVSTADFIKNYGTLADRALAEPVTITKNGRDRLVVVSVAEYDRLKRRDRRVVGAEDLSDQELSLIAEARAPAEYGHLDVELENWKP